MHLIPSEKVIPDPICWTPRPGHIEIFSMYSHSGNLISECPVWISEDYPPEFWKYRETFMNNYKKANHD